MAIKIQFDSIHNPESPTLILAKRNGEQLGKLNAKNIILKDDLNNPSEISFSVNKYIDGKKTYLWDNITNFKLLWCVEWNTWFEITVDINEDDKSVKKVSCTELSQAELSQSMLYNIEINTETDIEREDYVNPTVLYKPDVPSESLLNRIMEKVPHYKIIHVDSSIMNIQRSFTFDGESIYDAFQKIAEEIDCLFIFNSKSDKDGNIMRGISVYDLETNCCSCGHRGQFTEYCPKCGSANLTEGYGDDTTIFIDSEELANSIQLTTDIGSVKNCFKLEAGDDLMTATIRNCNPNGTDYIWYISNLLKEDMSLDLVSKLESYDKLYKKFQNNFEYIITNNSIIYNYNELIKKYLAYNQDLKTISLPIKGYSSLIQNYYNTIDFSSYLKSVLMPSSKLSDTSAQKQLEYLVTKNLSPVSSTDINYLSSATADNLVLQMAKAFVDSRYKVDIVNSSLSKKIDCFEWTGKLRVTNYSDEEDTATHDSDICIIIDNNYQSYVEQRLRQALHEKDTQNLSITDIFNLPLNDFTTELKKYCLDSLLAFENICQGCIDILIEQDISNPSSWANKTPNMYDEVYLPYYNKLQAIEKEVNVREKEISIICSSEDNDKSKIGIQTELSNLICQTQNTLNFQSYLGETLWNEFITYRREDKYSNSNYISDGLNNEELFKQAKEFIEIAEKEIYKSSELQHSISCSLKNLLFMKKFEPLIQYFEVGNWIRIMIDGVVYKLRLLSYEIDYDNPQDISVEFSDVFKIADGFSDQQSVISQSINMASSYSSTQRQATQGVKSHDIIKNWTQNGVNTVNTKIVCGANSQTQTWDEHGMLFRRINSLTGLYDDVQMKIINSTLAITNDNWKSTKTAVGLFKYNDPITGELKDAYGINGEVILGKLFIGEGLGIYNRAGSLTFDENGFVVSNGNNIISINPNSNLLFNIKNKDGNVFTFDDNGDLVIVGNITAKSLTLLSDVTVNATKINGLSDVAVSGSYNDLKDKPNLSYENIEGIPTLSTVATSGDYNDLENKPTLSDVAVSGSYNDLKDKPNLSEYLLQKQNISDIGKFLYINENMNIDFISIEELKALLGINISE